MKSFNDVIMSPYFDCEEGKIMDEMQNTLEKVCKQISENHHKIIDDWCKAYLAELYEEGHTIKPGNFALCEQEATLNSDGFLGKKYWFRFKTKEDFNMTEWTKVKDGLPENMLPVIVIADGGEYRVDYFDPSEGWQKGYRVVAWKSFKQYEEEEE